MSTIKWCLFTFILESDFCNHCNFNIRGAFNKFPDFFVQSVTLKNWFSIHARWSKSSLKHSIRFCGIFQNLKHSFTAYLSSKVSSRPDCIFEIHQLWQSDFSRVYSNCCCSCSFEPEIPKINQSSHEMYSNNILNFQMSMTILNASKKNSGNLLEALRILKLQWLQKSLSSILWLIF